MSQEIINKLPRHYEVKALIDLSDVSTEILLYKTIYPLREEKYCENTRIIFYHTQELIYTFDDLPADIVILLQRMLVYIDIPNYFCAICSTKDLTAELKYVCEKYAVNEIPMTYICLK